MKMGRFEKWFVNSERNAPRVIERAERLLAHADMSGKRDFLEVGCGAGAMCVHIAGKYPLNVTGVDVDPGQISLARRTADGAPNVRFTEADATALPFGDGEFDIVLAQNMLHHVYDWLDALGEMNRVMRPGGYLIYTDLVYPQWAARLGSSRMGARLAHAYGFPTAAGLEAFAARNGFATMHAVPSAKHLLIFNEYHAVYRKPS